MAASHIARTTPPKGGGGRDGWAANTGPALFCRDHPSHDAPPRGGPPPWIASAAGRRVMMWDAGMADQPDPADLAPGYDYLLERREAGLGRVDAPHLRSRPSKKPLKEGAHSLHHRYRSHCGAADTPPPTAPPRPPPQQAAKRPYTAVIPSRPHPQQRSRRPSPPPPPLLCLAPPRRFARGGRSSTHGGGGEAGRGRFHPLATLHPAAEANTVHVSATRRCQPALRGLLSFGTHAVRPCALESHTLPRPPPCQKPPHRLHPARATSLPKAGAIPLPAEAPTPACAGCDGQHTAPLPAEGAETACHRKRSAAATVAHHVGGWTAAQRRGTPRPHLPLLLASPELHSP